MMDGRVPLCDEGTLVCFCVNLKAPVLDQAMTYESASF